MKKTINNKKRGSALAAAVIIAACVGIVAASTSRRANAELRLNYRSGLIIEARNAAEAVVECGFAQLTRRFDSNVAFPANALKDNPLVLDSGFFNLFSGGSGMTGTNVLLPPSGYNPRTTSVGTYPTEIIGGVVPPGSWITISRSAPGNEYDPLAGSLAFVRSVKVYGRATVQGVTGGPVTAYCSQDLQVRDTPLFSRAIFYNMDLEIAPGASMDIFGSVHSNGDMYVQTSARLQFRDNVTAVGNLRHGVKSGFPKGVDNGEVNFINASGSQVSMRINGEWLDSRKDDWHDDASQRWDGTVQDAAFGTQVSNPVTIKSYEPDLAARRPSDDNTLNYAYSLIMPLDTTGTADPNIEQQKYSYKAGLIVDVSVNSNGDITGYTLGTPQRDLDGNIIYSGNTPQIKPLNSSDPDISAIFTISNYSTTSSGRTTVNGGLWDVRRGKGISLLEVDMHALRDAVHSNDETQWGEKPSTWWNGVVYVGFTLDPRASVGADGIRPARDGTGLKLYNGGSTSTEPGIPDPQNPNDYKFDAPRGTTIATNDPLYVQGNYNADGSTSTGSERDPDNSSEPPAALAADSITILSNNWQDSRSSYSRGERLASRTEVSAAILTGLVPSDKYDNNRYSGGVENFPRFLEQWSGVNFYYRGSMVSLFESEVATEPWGNDAAYNAPNRRWGFNTLFAQGLYPPGTPNTRSYRRVNFRFLTQPEWNNAISAL